MGNPLFLFGDEIFHLIATVKLLGSATSSLVSLSGAICWPSLVRTVTFNGWPLVPQLGVIGPRANSLTFSAQLNSVALCPTSLPGTYGAHGAFFTEVQSVSETDYSRCASADFSAHV